VALVTAATSGIGASVAKGLTQQGATAMVTGRHTVEGHCVARIIVSSGGVAEFCELDVRDGTVVAHVIALVASRFGRIDVSVNCAGIGRRVARFDEQNASG
jgi:NAD(P)-dependent dehydrogenase (short-subunit alcohol dehydrogenase family)